LVLSFHPIEYAKSECLWKEITMNPIDHVQRADESCTPDGEVDAWSTFDTPEVNPLSLGGESRVRARVRRNDADDIFASHSARLFGVAYRMLGSRADAEDLLQDVYLRWHQSATHDIQSPVAFLVKITTRLCLDRLRALKQQRAQYVGPWMPEPIVDDHMPSPEMQLQLADDVSVGFLAVLERLGPEEGAAFLLHDVFDYDYREVAQILGKTEPSCRQIIHRARARVRDSRPRFAVTPKSRERLLKKFLAAIGTGDRQAVMALLAEKVEYVGRRRWRSYCRNQGTVLSFETDGARIHRIYSIPNPDKLGGVCCAIPASDSQGCHNTRPRSDKLARTVLCNADA
jgi:RNA polymerase sigma factor (sigma-70 family)